MLIESMTIPKYGPPYFGIFAMVTTLPALDALAHVIAQRNAVWETWLVVVCGIIVGAVALETRRALIWKRRAVGDTGARIMRVMVAIREGDVQRIVDRLHADDHRFERPHVSMWEFGFALNRLQWFGYIRAARTDWLCITDAGEQVATQPPLPDLHRQAERTYEYSAASSAPGVVWLEIIDPSVPTGTRERLFQLANEILKYTEERHLTITWYVLGDRGDVDDGRPACHEVLSFSEDHAKATLVAVKPWIKRHNLDVVDAVSVTADWLIGRCRKERDLAFLQKKLVHAVTASDEQRSTYQTDGSHTR